MKLVALKQGQSGAAMIQSVNKMSVVWLNSR